jgi:hypothetical protein
VVAKRRTKEGAWERPMLTNARELAQAQPSVELKTVPVEGKPSITDEASKRQQLEFKPDDPDIEPNPPIQDASFDDDGRDPDPDDNSYGNVKINGGRTTPPPGGRTPGGGTPNARSATAPEETIGIFTWVRRRLFGNA